MSSSLNYRTLGRNDLGQMYRSFIEAFSSYQVDMKMSREVFEDRMLFKLNIDFDLSVGLFSGDKLVGFIFQSINEYEGERSAYNGGTGVIPGYLGQGLTVKMYDFLLPRMAKAGVKQCVLEVLVDNDFAIRAYEKAGFKKTKTFQCLMLKDGVLKRSNGEFNAIVEVKDFSSEEYQALITTQPSMLDQLSQIQCHIKKEIVLEYRSEGELVGYAIFQPINGRIAQIAVKKTYRRRGIGSALLERVHTLSKRKTLSVLNIDSNESTLIDFFISLGFIRDLEQYEMQRHLTDV